MASLFTAPRSRRVVYSTAVPTADELNKIQLNQYNKNRWTGTVKKAWRVIADQVPFIKPFLPGQNPQFILPGVQTIKWTMARDITEQYGLQSYTMLPWYTKAVVIVITGKAYLGAFATDVTSSSGLVNTSLQSKYITDYIRDEMQRMDQLLGGTNLSTQPTQSASSNLSLISSLGIGNDGEDGSMKVLGFIKSFEVDEDVKDPYVQKYVITYIGVDEVWYAESRARNRAGKDKVTLASLQARMKQQNG